MSLNYELTKIKDWCRTCFVFIKTLPDGYDSIEKFTGPGSDWFPVKDHFVGDEGVRDALLEEGYLAACMDPTLHGLIFMGLVLQPKGGSITEKNFPEWVRRCLIWQEITENMAVDFDGKEWTRRPITPDDIRKFVGLWTNCSPVTDAEFAKKVLRLLDGRVQQTVKSLKQEKVHAAAN